MLTRANLGEDSLSVFICVMDAHPSKTAFLILPLPSYCIFASHEVTVIFTSQNVSYRTLTLKYVPQSTKSLR